MSGIGWNNPGGSFGSKFPSTTGMFQERATSPLTETTAKVDSPKTSTSCVVRRSPSQSQLGTRNKVLLKVPASPKCASAKAAVLQAAVPNLPKLPKLPK